VGGVSISRRTGCRSPPRQGYAAPFYDRVPGKSVRVVRVRRRTECGEDFGGCSSACEVHEHHEDQHRRDRCYGKGLKAVAPGLIDSRRESAFASVATFAHGQTIAVPLRPPSRDCTFQSSQTDGDIWAMGGTCPFAACRFSSVRPICMRCTSSGPSASRSNLAVAYIAASPKSFDVPVPPNI